MRVDLGSELALEQRAAVAHLLRLRPRVRLRVRVRVGVRVRVPLLPTTAQLPKRCTAGTVALRWRARTARGSLPCDG